MWNSCDRHPASLIHLGSGCASCNSSWIQLALSSTLAEAFLCPCRNQPWLDTNSSSEACVPPSQPLLWAQTADRGAPPQRFQKPLLSFLIPVSLLCSLSLSGGRCFLKSLPPPRTEEFFWSFFRYQLNNFYLVNNSFYWFMSFKEQVWFLTLTRSWPTHPLEGCTPPPAQAKMWLCAEMKTKISKERGWTSKKGGSTTEAWTDHENQQQEPQQDILSSDKGTKHHHP